MTALKFPPLDKEPAAYPDFSEARYHADQLFDVPTLNRGTAVDMAYRTPLHAWTNHPRLNGGYEAQNKTAFDLGTAVHTWMGSAQGDIVRIPVDDYKTADARRARDEAYAAGKTPLTDPQYEDCELIVDCAHRQLAGHEIGDPFRDDSGTIGGCMAVWEAHGAWKRAQFDRIDPAQRTIYDLKTTGQSAEPSSFVRTAINQALDMQAAHYIEGASTVFGWHPSFWRLLFVVVEVKPPFALSVVELPSDLLELGRAKMEMASHKWRRCINKGTGPQHWPGYPATICKPEAPAFGEVQWGNRADVDTDAQERASTLELNRVWFEAQAPAKKDHAA